MVSHESPCLTFGPGFLKQQGKPLEKGRPVGIIEKNVLSLDPPHNDMLEDVQVIYSSGSWHGQNDISQQVTIDPVIIYSNSR